jgi:methionyl-tRNA synthetase
MFCGRKKIICGFDAPIGYISATKNGLYAEGKDWEPYWKIKTPSWFTLLGKTISFSLCDFPAMLKAEGSYILPENVPANEFLNLGK